MTVDLVLLQRDLTYARTCYIDYKTDNTMEITEDEYQAIVDGWSKYFPTWDAYMESLDENGYTFTDDEYDDAVQQGRENAEEESGYENNGWDITGQTANNTSTAAYQIGAQVGGKALTGLAGKALGKAAAGAAEKACRKALEEAAKKGLEEAAANELAAQAGNKASEKVLQNAGIIVSCIFDLVMAGLYWITRPNKTQVDAVGVYANGMSGQQSDTKDAQSDLNKAGRVVKKSAEEAAKANDSANEKMAKMKAKYDVYGNTYEYLQSAQTRGSFTQDDVVNYNICVENMTEMGAKIEDEQDLATETVGAKYQEMADQQEVYDESKETIGNVEGYTKEAAGLDLGTKVACIIQAVLMGVNGAFAAVHAYLAGAVAVATGWCGAGIAYGAAAAAAGAAAFQDAMAVKEQISWANSVDKEITARETTEGINDGSKDVLEEGNESYKEYLADTEHLTLEIPEGVDAPPEASPTPTAGDGTDGNGDDDQRRRQGEV